MAYIVMALYRYGLYSYGLGIVVVAVIVVVDSIRHGLGCHGNQPAPHSPAILSRLRRFHRAPQRNLGHVVMAYTLMAYLVMAPCR